MIELIKNYTRIKLNLVLTYVLENFKDEDELTLSFEVLKTITQTKLSIEEELLSNSEIVSFIKEKKIKKAIEEVGNEFLNQISI